jgi:hypothetical protein
MTPIFFYSVLPPLGVMIYVHYCIKDCPMEWRVGSKQSHAVYFIPFLGLLMDLISSLAQAIPVSQNGKVDRKTLPSAEASGEQCNAECL